MYNLPLFIVFSFQQLLNLIEDEVQINKVTRFKKVNFFENVDDVLMLFFIPFASKF